LFRQGQAVIVQRVARESVSDAKAALHGKMERTQTLMQGHEICNHRSIDTT